MKFPVPFLPHRRDLLSIYHNCLGIIKIYPRGSWLQISRCCLMQRSGKGGFINALGCAWGLSAAAPDPQKETEGCEVRKACGGITGGFEPWSHSGLGLHSGGNGALLLVPEARSAVFWFTLWGGDSGTTERALLGASLCGASLSSLSPSIPGSVPHSYQQAALFLSKQCHCHFTKT